MLGNLIAGDHRIAGKVVHQQAGRQAGDNLLIQRAFGLQFNRHVLARANVLSTNKVDACQRQRQQRQIDGD